VRGGVLRAVSSFTASAVVYSILSTVQLARRSSKVIRVSPSTGRKSRRWAGAPGADCRGTAGNFADDAAAVLDQTRWVAGVWTTSPSSLSAHLIWHDSRLNFVGSSEVASSMSSSSALAAGSA
jgi:hypothetical protein